MSLLLLGLLLPSSVLQRILQYTREAKRALAHVTNTLAAGLVAMGHVEPLAA